MQSINFQRHFAALGCAAVVFALCSRFVDFVPAGNLRIVAIYGLMGLLHAIALFLSLSAKSKISVSKALTFVTLVSAASVLTFFSLLVSLPLLDLIRLKDAAGFFAMWISASAFGASAYWLLVRMFWFDWLGLKSLGVTTGLCCVGTLGSLLAAAMVSDQGCCGDSLRQQIAGLLPTFGWWLAFSLALYLNQVTAGRSTPQSLLPQEA